MRTLRTIVAISALAGLAIAGSASCLRSTSFTCDTSADCGGGTCETAQGFCSFADSSCTVSGRRFGEHSGPYANQCVGETTPPDDSGTDGPKPPIDGMDPPTGCKPTYMALPDSGPRGHRYRLVDMNLSWTQHRDACAADNAFLAFPDGAALADAQAELAALRTLAGDGAWVGVNDITTEATFRTSLNQPVSAITQMLIAVGGGNPNGQDCLVIAGTTLTDESCNDTRKAVCECVP